MPLKRLDLQTSHDVTFAVRVQPIGDAELELVQAAMEATAPDWSVELQGFCSDESTLILLPEDGEDKFGPSFMISRESYGFRVDQVHWDVVAEIGVFESMHDVVDALRLRLGFGDDLEPPVAVTLH